MKDYKMIRRILTVLLATVLIAGSISVVPADAATAKKPSLSAKKITIAKGMKYKLKVKNKKSSVKWSSSNKKVVKVTSLGKVTGIKDGTATIKATIKSGGKKKTLKCRVKVRTPKFKKRSIRLSRAKS